MEYGFLKIVEKSSESYSGLSNQSYEQMGTERKN
jgi:hypothetical protein